MGEKKEEFQEKKQIGKIPTKHWVDKIQGISLFEIHMCSLARLTILVTCQFKIQILKCKRKVKGFNR